MTDAETRLATYSTAALHRVMARCIQSHRAMRTKGPLHNPIAAEMEYQAAEACAAELARRAA